MRGADDEVQHLVIRRIDVDQVHARRRHHHVARRHVGHADHAFEHDARIGANHVVAFGLGQGFNQLFGRVGARVDELHQFLQKRALVFAFRRARRVWFGHSLGCRTCGSGTGP